MTSTHGKGPTISPSGLSRRPARFAPGAPPTPKGARWEGPSRPAGGFDEALQATVLNDSPFNDSPLDDSRTGLESTVLDDSRAGLESTVLDDSRAGLESTVLDDSRAGLESTVLESTVLESTVLDDSQTGRPELETTVLDDSRMRPRRDAASERIRSARPVRAQGTPRPQLIGLSPQGPCPPAPARLPAATPSTAFTPVPASVAARAASPLPSRAASVAARAASPLPSRAASIAPAPRTVSMRAPLRLPLPPDSSLEDLPPPRKPASRTAPLRALLPAPAEAQPSLQRAPLSGPGGAPPRLQRAPLLPAPASRAPALPASFMGEMPTIPERLWGGAPSLFDGTTLGKTPFPADVLPPGLIEEDAPLDRNPDERGMLAAIAAGDETSRLIYADWLEDQDEHARAGYLRIEQLVSRLAPDDPRYAACTRQLRELAQHVDADWRARVARPPIEGCASADARCPRRWDALARTDREAIRRCGPCAKQVHYFETVDEARDAARRGTCVAIDLGAERWENDLNDLGTRCDGCARHVVSTARYCPHCGATVRKSEELEVRVIQVGDDD
jgi:uncharacterized protein (TIGR02996 family)